jgi:hypothetical protein
MNGITDTLDRPQEATPVQLPVLARLHEWVVTVDHKRLGIMYVGVGLVFLLVAGLEATLMRLQLAVPGNTLLSPQVFNRLFTMHGTTMVFFVGIPIVFGFANYLVPLMIGTRDLAFPRLNAFGFWLLLFGGLLLYFSYLAGDGLYGAGTAPDVGWFAYSPLTGRAFSRGNSTDYWNLAILVSGFGTVATSVNLVATILTMRCPGMILGRMPLYAWMLLVVSGMTMRLTSAPDRWWRSPPRWSISPSGKPAIGCGYPWRCSRTPQGSSEVSSGASPWRRWRCSMALSRKGACGIRSTSWPASRSPAWRISAARSSAPSACRPWSSARWRTASSPC